MLQSPHHPRSPHNPLIDRNLSSTFGFTTSGNCYKLFLQEGSFVKGTLFSSGSPEHQDGVKNGSTLQQRNIHLLIGPVLPLNDYFG